jgi:hypothetical protein
MMQMIQVTKKNHSLNNKGQSTIEFLLTFIFAFAFLLLFLKTAFNITNGFMVHYATFLASRTYLVWDNNSNDSNNSDINAATMARETFSTVPLGAIFRDFNGELEFNSPGGASSKLFTGVYVRFNDMMNMGRLLGGQIELDLISESFLLREPTRTECLERVCSAMREMGGGAVDCSIHVTLVDNGC